MKQSLRRRHIRMWAVLAILLPVGFVAAYVNIPQFPVEEKRAIERPDALVEILKEAETPLLKVNLRGYKDGRYRQLELILKQPLQVPSALLFLKTPESQHELLTPRYFLGQTGSTGVERYMLPGDGKDAPLGILLYDIVKDTLITEVDF